MGCADCQVHGADAEAIFSGRWYAFAPLRNALIAGVIAGIAFLLGERVFEVIGRNVEIAAYCIAIVLGGYHWILEGLEGLVHDFAVGIEVLMIAATAGSIVLGMWDEAAALVFLYGAAEGIEHYTYVRTRRSIRALLDLVPPTATVLVDGEQRETAAEDLRSGDLFLVRPGQTVATDGEIVEGRSFLNEAPVTGESLPVEREAGDQVFAGTINGEGPLTVRATEDFEHNTLSRMIHLVEEAQERKGTRQLFIERFGKVYTPLVLLTAVLMVVLAAAVGADVADWATRAVVLLVAAAPCALIMSTPVGIAAAIGRAGKTGVLVKGGAHLEELGRVRVVAFDKTGTLTAGEPVVTDVVGLNGDRDEVLAVAAALESRSEHPLGEAIVRHAREVGVTLPEVTEFRSITGAGVSGRLNGTTAYVGSPRLCEELGVAAATAEESQRLQAEGRTVVCVTTDHGPLGLIALGDTLRPEAEHAIQDLHAMEIRTVMLTGDNQQTARAIAQEAGIEDVRAELTPEQKIAAVVELEREQGAVAVVGEGINDAPALAQATVGIAMGTGGTDAAIEAADTALVGDDLTLVPFAIRLGRRSVAVGTQNIVFALLVLAALIPSAVLGLISVGVAVLLHEASELIAVFNGTRVGTRRTLYCPRGVGGVGACVKR
jgi:heavy metal translocating P-type ATPase